MKIELKKFKGTSVAFFGQNNEKFFDLIYIDGNHYFDYVLVDAIKSFELLKLGGLMIFDDYLFSLKGELNVSPKELVIGAVNVFLNSKIGKYEILHVSYQLIIRKIPY